MFFKRDILYNTVNDAEDGENYDEEIKLKNEVDTELDPNHSHFILIDDGSIGLFGKEIDFRSNFLNELRKGKSRLYYENTRFNIRTKFDSVCSGYENVSVKEIKQIAEEDEEDDFFEAEELKSGLMKATIPMILVVRMILCL
jgi:hypothetical protein